MRETIRLLTVGLSLLIVAGCSDNTTNTAPATRSFAPVSAPSFDLTSSSGQFGLSSTDFTVTPSGGSFSIGGGLFTVNFPANSVCKPTSSYGPGEWDKPCATLSAGESVRIHANVVLGANGLGVDFSPALRFSPSSQVTLSTDIFARIITLNRDFFAKYPSTLRPLAIYYAPTVDDVRTPDYLSDPSLVTHVDLTTGRVWRRVKHFTAYSVATGEPCDPSPGDPDCIEVDGHEQ